MRQVRPTHACHRFTSGYLHSFGMLGSKELDSENAVPSRLGLCEVQIGNG